MCTNACPIYVCKPFCTLAFATQKKQNVSFQPPISGISSADFSYRAASYFLRRSGGNVTLLTQSVTFGSRCCIRTNPRHVYVYRRFTPIFFATQKNALCHFGCRFSVITPAYFCVLFWCKCYTFDTKCDIRFSVVDVPERLPRLCS